MLAPNALPQNGRYRIIRQIGQGGMGAVYEAWDQRLDTRVALKEALETFTVEAPQVPSSTTTPNSSLALPVLAGTPVPQPAVPISPDNVLQVAQLAWWDTGPVWAVAYSPNSELLAIISPFRSFCICLFDVQSSELAQHIEANGRLSVAFSPDGQLLASGMSDGTVRLWEVSGGRERATLSGHVGNVNSVAFSPDGQLLASGARDGTVRLWEVSSRRERVTLTGHIRSVQSVAFSPDGQLLASGSWDNTVRVWEVSSGREQAILTGHTGGVEGVAFSPDGQLLASGSWDNTVRLWEVNNGRERATLRGHTNWVRSVVFSADGQLVASGSHDRTVRLWEVSSGRERISLSGHAGDVVSVAFSPDGQLLASGSSDAAAMRSDGTVRLWGVPP